MSINLAQLKQQQIEYASNVLIKDDIDYHTVSYIGGTDVGFDDNGQITRAAIVVLSWPSLSLVEYKISKQLTNLPYIPGYLSFREYPALVAAWQLIKQKPQLLFVDGQGIAHPRRLGIASHLGLLLDVPTIGIAKKKLYGQYQPLDDLFLATQPLFDNTGQEQIGTVLRSKIRCKPLFISPGHRVSQQSAVGWIKACLKGYRLPEPTRFADAIASNKPLAQKLLSTFK